MNGIGSTSQMEPVRVRQVLNRVAPFILSDQQLEENPNRTELLSRDFRNIPEEFIREEVLPDLKLTEADFQEMERIAKSLEKRAFARESIEKAETPTSVLNKSYLKSRLNQIRRSSK